MFERLQKPFLTVETGEAYQPVRIAYDLLQPDKLKNALGKLKCVEPKTNQSNSWDIFWRNESDDIHFESLESFKKQPSNPVRLGTLVVKENTLYLNLPSFKRACLIVPVLHQLIDSSIIQIKKADFINKVFGLNERLPHGLTEIYDDAALEDIMRQRIHDYKKVQEACEHASTAEEAFQILSDYTYAESKKRLPFAESFLFHEMEGSEMDHTFLGFYIYLRSRELVAIRRWFGESGFSLSDALDETFEQVFGGMNIEIIE